MGNVTEAVAPTGTQPSGALASGTQSVERALALLHLVGAARENGARLTDLVSQTGLNNPTVRRLLLSLVRAGLVEQDEDSRRYFLGAEAHVLGTLAGSRFGIHRLALDSLARLADASQDTAFLSIARESFAVCLHREEGGYPIRSHVLQAGDRHPLGLGAGSLALLAALPDAEVEHTIRSNAAILAERYPHYDPTSLRTHVAETRARGYALNPGLIVAGSWGIGVHVAAADGTVLGALSIAAVEHRLGPDRQDMLGGLLREEARRLAARVADAARPSERRGAREAAKRLKRRA